MLPPPRARACNSIAFCTPQVLAHGIRESGRAPVFYFLLSQADEEDIAVLTKFIYQVTELWFLTVLSVHALSLALSLIVCSHVATS